MSEPVISVVIPAFNSAWSIRDTVRSVFAQTVPDFELIIVDDGSTDDVVGALSEWLGRDPRIRVVHQDNGGLAAARNRGLAEAKCPLIGFVDADDMWHPDFLQALSAALARVPAAPFAYAHSIRIDEENRILGIPPWSKEPRHDFAGLLTLNSVGNGSAALFRREAVLAAGGFDPTLKARGAQGAEDWKLCLRLAAQHPPVLVRRHLVAYRLVVSGMSQGDPSRQLRAVRAVMDDIRAEFPGTPERHFRNAATLMNGWLLGAFLKRGEYRTALRLIAESYVLNPFWFLSADILYVHWMKLVFWFGGSGQPTPLAQHVENGARPFAFLEVGKR